MIRKGRCQVDFLYLENLSQWLSKATVQNFQLLFDPSRKFRLKIEAHDKLVI